MEAKKYSFCGREFTMKNPSYKRCQQIRELLGEGIATGYISDVQKMAEALKVAFDGNFDGIDFDELTIGQIEPVAGMFIDFFTKSAEMK